VPELPEVETVVRDLRPLVVGRTIRGVRHGPKALRTPWQPEWNAHLAGLRIDAIRRRGKWIVIDLGGPHLVVHLGMTGQFTAVAASEDVRDHLHVVFELNGSRELRFRDPRRFGSVTVHPGEAAVEAFFATAGLGPEPFGLDPEYFRTAVRKSARTLKAILLDQTVVAGVGNIYADEACFRARVHPKRRGTSLSAADADRLREAIEVVLTHAIERRGSTIRDYVGGSGLGGGFQHEHAVYGRTGDPCGACGAAIRCVRLSSRASHFCPVCQRTNHKDTKGTKKKLTG
jgi:formamidopyrimidine-DNA glycosylase